MISIHNNVQASTGLSQSASANNHPASAPVVQLQNPQSKLISGAEELTFGRTGLRLDRNRKAVKPRENTARQQRLQRVLNLLKASSGKNPFAQSGRRILQANAEPRQQAAEESADPFEQFMMLATALDGANSGDVDAQRMAEILQALDELEEDYPAEIRAKVNAFEASTLFGRNNAEAAEFRDSYLELVLASTLGEALDKLLKRFGKKPYGRRRFRRALYDYISVLGEEIDSQWASLEREVLQALRGKLRDSQSVVTLLEECTGLLQRFHKRRTLQQYDPVGLTRELVSLASKTWILDGRFGELAQRFVDIHPAEQLQFIRRIYNTLRFLPETLFNDDSGRENIISTAQRELDQHAEQETLWMPPN